MYRNSPGLRRVMDRGLTLAPPEKHLPLSEETGTDVYEFLPAEPYSTIIGYFLNHGFGEIVPVDSESSLYLPRIPVQGKTGAERAAALRGSGVLITSRGTILTGGRDDPLLLFSIACFSLFVAFFHLILQRKRGGVITTEDFEILRRVQMYDFRFTPSAGDVRWSTGMDLPERISAAGKSMVSGKLVDSIFGNLSAREGDRLVITEAGSFLDSLEGSLTHVPLEGQMVGGKTPSSEVEVHRSIYRDTGYRFIVHGHPLFTVILSLDVSGTGEKMSLPGGISVPVVEGDDSPDRKALCASLPRAIAGNGSAVIRGHGIFTAHPDGFSMAIQNIKEIENYCRETYLRRLR